MSRSLISIRVLDSDPRSLNHRHLKRNWSLFRASPSSPAGPRTIITPARYNTYLEAKNYCPYEPEWKSRITVYDIVRAHILQMHSLFFQKLQRLVYIFQTVYTHFSFRRSGLQTEMVIVSRIHFVSERERKRSLMRSEKRKLIEW